MIEHILRTSLERNRIATIIYMKHNQITIRNIKVLETGSDSVKAYCFLRKQLRTFKKQNILSAELYRGSNSLYRQEKVC